MENWHLFSDPRFRLRFRYPTTTPQGHAYAYSFTWPHKERAVLLIQQDQATYRIIYDPHSVINGQIVSTVELVD